MDGAGKALLLKEEGNRHFQAGNFVSAEALYSKALIADARNPALYTNRAMARLKMGLWDGVVEDCNECLKLSPGSMKAHYYLAQAYGPLHEYDVALEHALKAHAICVQTDDKSLSAATARVLQCKKERWDAREKRRRREHARLEMEVLAVMAREKEAVLEELAEDGDTDPATQREIVSEWDAKLAALRAIFDKARADDDRRREIPDWAVDDITFNIMVDPVITKTGKSYERASLMEHLIRHPTDPLTREPLLPRDLRSNLDLKEACAEFLDENGWAVDW